METTAFLEYLDEHGATATLAGSLRDLVALRRDRAQLRALVRRGALLPIPVPVEPPCRRVAS